MPIGVRNPGALPNVLARVENARALLRRDDIDQSVRDVVEGILAAMTTQHEFNKRIWEGRKGSTEPHADTHKGGDDSVTGRQLPGAITSGDAGQIGDPALGYAPINHTHPTPYLWGHVRTMIRVSLGF